MDQHNQNPYMTVGSGQTKVVPQGVTAHVLNGGTAIVNGDANAAFESGSQGFIMTGGDLVFSKGANIYLQVNTAFFAGMDWFSVQNGLGVQQKEVFYAMPKWFWQRKDWRHPGRK